VLNKHPHRKLASRCELIITDVLRDSETWLVDEALTISAQPGMAFAGRLCWPAEFAMTCGVVVPVDAELLEEVMLYSLAWLRHAHPEQLADDPRFAAALYPRRSRHRHHGQRRVHGAHNGRLSPSKWPKPT
jgi:hypothetical protein